jgi:hypothetical protein
MGLLRRVVVATATLACLAGSAHAQMPDPRMMSGQIIPSPELPTGTVTVRVIRQTIMNVAPGIDVQLLGAGEPRHATTGPEGRAQFSGLRAGAHVHAVAVVDGEQLQSIEFDVPPSGGVRTLLAAGVGVGTMLSGAAAPVAPAAPAAPAAQAGQAETAAPPAPGQLVFANDTRMALEFQDDTVAVFYLLDIVNSGRAPAALAAPLVIDLPADASGAALLEGGSPLAKVNGRRVTVIGPLPVGVTTVPIAYRVESWDETWTLAQSFPLPIPDVAVAIQKVGDMHLQGASAPTVKESRLQGTPFLMATGASLAAGVPLQLTVTGMPHKSRTPIYVTLTLSVALVCWGVWMVFSEGRTPAASYARELAVRREKGLAALAALERRHASRAIDDATYVDRRQALIADLEQIYGELDDRGGLPGGGQGLAA